MAIAYARYSGVAKELVHLFKYEHRHHVASTMAVFMTSVLPSLTRDYDTSQILLVPVPIYSLDRFMRRFSHAGLIAHRIAQFTGLDLAANAIIKRRRTLSQARLSRTDRIANLKDVFEFNPRSTKSVRGKIVILIDDVLTTGTTAAECSIALRKAGASDVRVLTFCRSY